MEFQLKTKKLLSKLFAGALAFTMVATSLPVTAIAAGGSGSKATPSLESQQSAQILSHEARPSGLVGFEEEYELGNSDSMVSVIVEFVHQPASLVQAIAELNGERSTSARSLENLAEQDKEDFYQALKDIDYTVEYEYDLALNGVSILVPEHFVDDIAALECVFAVYPNETHENVVPNDGISTFAVDGFAEGMADSRAYLNIQALHDQNIKGTGVTVGVIDTGIDYRHPDLKNVFSSKLPNGSTPSADELLNGNFVGRNYITNGNGKNDPLDDQGHGTHVAGTIAARDNATTDISALGLAPESTIVAYKVINAADSCSENDVIKAMEDAVKDGCEIISMSLGWKSINHGSHGTTIALNALALTHENVLFVVCAGNSGSNSYTIWSPAASPLALTVANAKIPSSNRLLTLTTDAVTKTVAEEELPPEENPVVPPAGDAVTPPEGEEATPPADNEGSETTPPEGETTPPEDKEENETTPPEGETTPPADNEGSETTPPEGETTPPENKEENEATPPAPPADEEEPSDNAGASAASLPEGGEPSTEPKTEGENEPATAPEDNEQKDPNGSDEPATVPGDDEQKDPNGSDEPATVPGDDEQKDPDGSNDPATVPGNGTLGSTDPEELQERVASKEAQIRLIRSDWKDAIIEDSGIYTISNSLIADSNDKYQMVLLPTEDNSEIGTGTDKEFEAFFTGKTADDYEGALFILRRGQNFDTSVSVLHKYVDKGAIAVINNQNDFESISYWQGYYKNYAPVFTVEKSIGDTLVADLTPGESYLFQFTAAEDLTSTSLKDGTAYPAADTSIGPVKETYDLKPDLAAPGSAIISTYFNRDGSDDYEYSYTAMNGTSMATPHVSAIAALIRQKYPSLTALEIKSLLVNTASREAFADDISRMAVGAGMVDPAAALAAAEDMVTMTTVNNHAYVNNNGTVEAREATTPTISMEFVPQGEAATRTAEITVKNAKSSPHTYDITLVNPRFTEVNGSTSATTKNGVFTVDESSITVPANGSATFTLTAAVPSTDTNGSYEVTVVLTENGGDSVLSSPAAVVVYTAPAIPPMLDPPVNANFTYLHSSVFSSGEKAQLKDFGWHGSDTTFFQYRFRDPNVFSWQPFLYTTEGEVMGYIDEAHENTWEQWDWWWEDSIGSWYTPCTLTENTNQGKDSTWTVTSTGELQDIPEGKYELRLLVRHADGKGKVVKVSDFCVDNTLPTLTLSNGSSSQWTGVAAEDNVVFSGNIFDTFTEEMKDAGINSVLNQRLFSKTTSQQDNIVVVRIGDNDYRAEIDEEGNFTVTVPKAEAAGKAVVYYGDHFLPQGDDRKQDTFKDGFAPDALSYAFMPERAVNYMTNFAYRAANMDTMNVTLTYPGAPTVDPGNPGEPDNDSTGGGSFSSSSNDSKPANAPSANVGADGAVSAAKISGDAKKAVSSAKNGKANVNVTNAKTVGVAALSNMAKAAAKENVALTMTAKTTDKNGTVVAYLKFNAAKAAEAVAKAEVKEVKLGVELNTKNTKNVNSLFKKWFKNRNIIVIKMAQKGEFGFTVETVVKADLKGFNKNTLKFYNYNVATNTYKELINPNYTIDAKGFIHFNTTMGNYVIITDEPLVRK